MKQKHDLSHLTSAGRMLAALRGPLGYVRYQPSVRGDTSEVVSERLWKEVQAAVERAIAKAGDQPHQIIINGTLQIYVVPPEVDGE